MKKILLAGFVFIILGCNSEKVTENNSDDGQTGLPNVEVTRTPNPDCNNKGFVVQSPSLDLGTSFPIFVEGVVDNREAGSCRWTVFEGQAGRVEVFDVEDNLVSDGVLKTIEDWMTDEPRNYKAILNLGKAPVSKDLRIVITEEDPSGEGLGEKIEFPAVLR